MEERIRVTYSPHTGNGGGSKSGVIVGYINKTCAGKTMAAAIIAVSDGTMDCIVLERLKHTMDI